MWSLRLSDKLRLEDGGLQEIRITTNLVFCCAVQFAESVAVNLSDDDLNDFCTASGNNTVGEIMRMVTNPGYSPDPRSFQVQRGDWCP